MMKPSQAVLPPIRPFIVRLQQRSTALWRELPHYLIPAEGWSTFILLALVMYIVVWSVMNSGWIKPMPPLYLVALVPLFLGFIGAKMRRGAPWWHLLSLLLGLVAVVWSGVAILSQETWQERLVEVLVRSYSWVEVARTGGISTDLLPFALMLGALAWVIGYLTAWLIFKLHWTGVALVPSGLALLVNLSYLPPSFHFHFIIYLLCAMMLVMRLNYFGHQRRWKRDQVRYARDIILPFFGDTFVVSVLLLTLVWVIPSAKSLPYLDDLRERVSQPWEKTQTEFNRLFASVTARKPMAGQSWGRSLPFRGSVLLGDEVILTVRSPLREYWRAQSFDVYTGQGWVSSETVGRSIEARPTEVASKEYLSTREITQTIEMAFPSKVVYASGEPVRVTIPVVAEVLKEPSYTLDLEDASMDPGLPDDLRSLAAKLRLLQAQGTAPSEIVKALPAEVRGQSVVAKGQKIGALTVTRLNPYPQDTMGLRINETLKRGKSYDVVSRVSVASPDVLRSAGTDYPGWVRDRYLPLPTELPDRVRRVALRLTRSQNNPWDKATAIEAYLRGLNYSLTVDPPPPGRDGVDYFLFTSKTGYCDYFASAMAVMLRSIGIPARVSSGYASGTYDSEAKVYVVRALNSHSWPEVYFPAYGWVRFEPTPALPLPEYGATALEDEIALGLGGDPMLEDFYYDEEYLGLGFEAPGTATAWGWWRNQGSVVGSLLGVLLLSLAFATWFIWFRGVTHLTYATQVYERMCRLAALARLRHHPTQTPQEYAQRLARSLPAYTGDIQRITQGYERSFFGRQELGPVAIGQLERAWKRLRLALLKRIWPGR